MIAYAGAGETGWLANSASERGEVELRNSPERQQTIAETNAGVAMGCWSNAEWAILRDNTARPFEPGTFPLADGVSSRVGRLRGYGNAIVPQVAAVFVVSFLESVKEIDNAR